MRKPYQLVHSALPIFVGTFQGESKRTAGKDRLFFYLALIPSLNLQLIIRQALVHVI